MKHIKMTKNRLDAYWVLYWIETEHSMPYYDGMSQKVFLRAFKNRKRWLNPNSLYSKITNS